MSDRLTLCCRRASSNLTRVWRKISIFSLISSVARLGILLEIALDVEDAVGAFEELPLLDIEEIAESVSRGDIGGGDLDQYRGMEEGAPDSSLESAKPVVDPRLDESVEISDSLELVAECDDRLDEGFFLGRRQRFEAGEKGQALEGRQEFRSSALEEIITLGRSLGKTGEEDVELVEGLLLEVL